MINLAVCWMGGFSWRQGQPVKLSQCSVLCSPAQGKGESTPAKWELPAPGPCLLPPGKRVPSEHVSVSGVYHHLVAVGGTTPEAHHSTRTWVLVSPLPVSQQVKRRWESFVAIFPSVTLSWPASPQSPLGTTS